MFSVNDGIPTQVAGGGSRQSWDCIGIIDGAFMIQSMRLARLSWNELKGEFGNAYEVIRRGGEEKEVIIPLTGAQPKSRDDDEATAERIQINPPSPKPRREDPQIPLE